MGMVSDRFGLPAMFEVASGIAVVAMVIFLLFVNESNPHAEGTGIKLFDGAPFPAKPVAVE
jgi:sugar phosphate permease